MVKARLRRWHPAANQHFACVGTALRRLLLESSRADGMIFFLVQRAACLTHSQENLELTRNIGSDVTLNQ
jgi:hypothetical protein